jgi:hypothetical protein
MTTPNRYEEVWYVPQESWDGYSAGEAYRVQFVAPDAENPDALSVIRHYGRDLTVSRAAVRRFEHDRFGNPILPNRRNRP